MATQSNSTQTIAQRGGFLPVLRYGNFAGQGYAGRLGTETVIEHPSINGGKPILTSELTRTPQGLASFMKLAVQTEPNGYLDGVTRNHDIEYTVAEMRYMNTVQAVFDGRLPHQLTAQDKQSPVLKQIESERDREYWQADKRMLNAVADYQPTDMADTTYRSMLVTAFYNKAESGLFGYGYTQEAKSFYQDLKAKDPQIDIPTFGQSLGALGTANNLARAGFEALVTLPISPQERQFFNQHLSAGAYIDSSNTNPDGSVIAYDQMDYRQRIVVPAEVAYNVYETTVKMGNQTVTMRLDKTVENNPIFTKETRVNGELVGTQTIAPQAGESSDKGQFSVRAYDVVERDGQGNLLQSSTISKPGVPKQNISDDLQAKIDAVTSGDYSKVSDTSTNPYSPDATNGSDLQSDNHLHLADIPAPELASHFAGSNAGGAYGAGTLGGFDVLPLNGSASFLVNEDGDIAGEINRLPNGDLQIKNLYGEAVYLNQAGAVLSQQDYQQAQTQAQYSQAAGAIGLMNSIIGLQHWDDMGDLQRLAAVTSIYNVLDKMSGGETLPGNLGTAASVLGLLNALDQGNVGGIAYSGLSLLEHLTYDAATKMGLISDTLGGNFLPGLGFVLALDSGDPVSIVSSGINLGVALGVIPGWGTALALGISLFGAMFADDDQPMLEGSAHAQWDAAGNTQVITDQNAEGGGATAAGWMSSLVNGLQAQLAATQDAAGIGDPFYCYQVDSCLRLNSKGYRPISCMKRRRKPICAGSGKNIDLSCFGSSKIFAHLTLLGDAQSLNARQNRAALNDLKWKCIV